MFVLLLFDFNLQPGRLVEFGVCCKDRWVYGKKEDSGFFHCFLSMFNPFHMKPMNYTHIFSENDFSKAVPRLIQTSDVTKKKVKPWLFQRVASGWRWICEDGQHGWFPLSHTKTEEAAWETWEQVWTSDWFNHCMIRAQQKLMWKIIYQESFLFHFPLAFLKQTNKASKKHLGSYLFPRVLSARKRVSPALVSCDVIQAEGDQLKGWRAEEEAKDCVGELSIQYMMSDTGSCLPSKIVILAYDIYDIYIYIYYQYDRFVWYW